MEQGMAACRGIVLLSLLFGICTALPGRIHVAGLFESEDDELELAFRIAVDWLNTDETLLPNSRMVALVEKLHSQDSFKATQLCCGLLQKGVAAIFGPQKEPTRMHVQSICDDLEVPHVESRWDWRLLRDQLSVNLYPHPSVLNSAFVRLVNVWGWKKFFLVYEEDEAIVRMKDFLAEGEKQGWDIKMYQFRNTSSYRDTFWEIKRSTRVRGKPSIDADYRIVLDVSRKNLYTVMKAAQQVGMMTEHQKYLITSLDLHTVDIEDFQYGKTNITGLRLVQEDSQEFQRLLEEVNNRLTRRRDQPALKTLKTESALMYDSVRLLAFAMEQVDAAKNIALFPPISCNLMNKGIDGTSLVNFMKNAKMKTPGLSGLIEFDAEGFRSTVSFDVMYTTPKGLKKIGTILPGNRINITSPDSSEFEFLELEHSHFRVTTVMSDPYVMLRESSKQMKGNDRYEGYGIDLLNALADRLHFTYEIHPVKDSKYGKEDPVTGKWDGMVGEVVYGEADLAVADLTINSARLKGVDFTLPFMQTGISILFKKPTQKVTSLFSFLSPFSGEVWLLVMAAYTFISISFFLVGRLSPYEWSNPHPCRQQDQVEENVFSILNSMWFAIGSLMQQGSDIAPTAMSTRAITSIWYFFCLIMISSYTANLAAFLTVEKLVSPIESAEDLANQVKIKYGCLAGGSTSGFFQNSNMTTYKRMYKFMQENAEEVYVSSNIEGINKVKQGNYAYLMEATSIEYNIERECNLTQVGGLLDNKGYGIPVRKGSHKLRNWLSGGILQLQEEGLLHTFKERWWKQKKGGGSCSEASKTSGSVNELGLGNVGGVFVVMVIGICLSACVGVFEFLWFQRKLTRDPEMSLFKLLMREIKYAVTCGSSSKPAPKLKTSNAKESEENTKALPGYSSFY
ncbi:glutamate receptor ionotropic, kainate 2-like isoform X2 [Uloborus diversus]|uniref:glutamate receptor ionotropic, kainate 2-like isoform X1 n=1 Tax=Uloborus diversus TaxID=327109 RepID=UPI002409CA22|nr:glutamate receptor ionotropic, kainate 2-like isoform X1 [Uloborus diversus]XP_054720363.1 glutamate receptor ionotropic, kainate 2-like isoform X2 [Uloborus diversus]